MRGMCALAAAFVCASTACAADPFPSKPVRIVVPSSPGGALDITTRLVAQKMSEKLGQSVIVDNRAGGDTLLGTRLVKAAAPDGYTILAQANGFAAMPAIKTDPGFDPLKDFVAIGTMLRSPLVMYVGSDQPDHSVRELIARAKANPGRLSYAHGGVASPPHSSAAQFVQQTGIDVLVVPYKGVGNALPDVAAGRVTMIVAGYSGGLPYIQSGKLRPLAVTGTKRIPALPNVPTWQEQGVNFSYSLWLGLLAPAGTPKDVVHRLAEALKYATGSREINERLRAEGLEAMPASPDEFQDQLAKETTQMERLMRDLKIEKD